MASLKNEETSLELEDNGDSAHPIANCRRKKIKSKQEKGRLSH
jgi:hypothetical protein